MSKASAAFRLCLRGLAVFPISDNGKVPRQGSRGVKDATRSADVVRAMWNRWPQANIGVSCGSPSDIWVLDVDPRHGGDKTIRDLVERHRPIGQTVASVTPSHGFHLYFRLTSHNIRNSAGRVGPGIDVRGEGGYAIAPPSRLADGAGWAWVKSANRSSFLAAPDWLIDLAKPPERPPTDPTLTVAPPHNHSRYVETIVDDELATLAAAQEGQRNFTLNSVAFQLFRLVKGGHLPEPWVRDVLHSTALNIGLNSTEATKTICSAFAGAEPRTLDHVG